jgi:predicted DCC family thiol-disulfide oxidoreductase YuxK
MKQTIVFYDKSCPLCVGVTGWLHKIDHKKQFKLEPYQQSEILKRFPQIEPADCERQIHIINQKGKLMRGADAMFEVWRKSGHWTSFLGVIFRLPPFIWLARPIYRLVAKYRNSVYR